jgi:hypothetical protein
MRVERVVRGLAGSLPSSGRRLRQFGGSACPAFEVRITNCQYLEKYKIGDSLESESFLPGSNFGAVSDVRLWSLTFCLGIDSDYDRTDDLFSSEHWGVERIGVVRHRGAAGCHGKSWDGWCVAGAGELLRCFCGVLHRHSSHRYRSTFSK